MKYYLLFNLIMQVWGLAAIAFFSFKFLPKDFWKGNGKFIRYGGICSIIVFLFDTAWAIYLLFNSK